MNDRRLFTTKDENNKKQRIRKRKVVNKKH